MRGGSVLAKDGGFGAGAIHGDVHIHPSGRAVVRLPYRAGTFPLRAAGFQDREATGALARVLDSGDAAVLTSDSEARTSVVSGLGGVGKTQVALDYAEQLWASRGADLVVWVTAASREAIVSTYARLAGELTGIEEPDPETGRSG
jgi:hypothetical protein